jgi:4-hydroxy-tetrahydrodipicolinate synthase
MFHGIFCTGSAGEFASLWNDERQAVIEATVAAAKGRVPVLVGASANSSKEAVRYWRMAETVGADGVTRVHPYCSRPSWNVIAGRSGNRVSKNICAFH